MYIPEGWYHAVVNVDDGAQTTFLAAMGCVFD